jgi:hypothetical protein
MTWLRDVTIGAAGSPLFWLLAGFLLTFLLTRGVTCLIRAEHGVFSDLSLGDVHLHHMVWGLVLVLTSGTLEFAIALTSPWDLLPAIAFGAGAALMLDEFALMVYLRDVYWSHEGRRSIDAVITMMVVIGTFAIPFAIAPELLPRTSRPFFFAVVFAYIALMATSLLKGKAFTGILGLFLPPVLLIAALRLARPGSPWARLWYRNNHAKRLRAVSRYGPTSIQERYRRRVLAVLGGTLPERAAARGSTLEPLPAWSLDDSHVRSRTVHGGENHASGH